MDENEILALLTGRRKRPVFVCRLSRDLASIVGADDTAIWLTPATARKQESKHRDRNLALYLRAPEVISDGFVLVQPPYHLLFIFHERREKIRSFKAVVKATRDGASLFLVSVHRVDKTDVRAAYRRAIRLWDWKKGVREVGPPKNPT